EWLGPFRDAPYSMAEGERGLLRLEIQEPTGLLLLEEAIASEAFAWIDGLKVAQLRAADVPWLAASPLLAGLNSLSLFANVIDGLAALDVSDNGLGDAGVEALAGSSRVSALASLGLHTNGVSDDGVAQLASSPRLAGLDRLDLRWNGFGTGGARALAGSPHLR